MTTATLERLPDPDDDQHYDPVFNDNQGINESTDPNDVPEAETVLQPSLHNAAEYLDLLFSEAVSREVDVTELQVERADLDYDDDGREVHQAIGEITDDVIEAIQDAGYVVIEENDSLLIYGLGIEVPE